MASNLTQCDRNHNIQWYQITKSHSLMMSFRSSILLVAAATADCTVMKNSKKKKKKFSTTRATKATGAMLPLSHCWNFYRNMYYSCMRLVCLLIQISCNQIFIDRNVKDRNLWIIKYLLRLRIHTPDEVVFFFN